MLSRCPAAYARWGVAGDRQALAEAAAQRGWPVPVVYAGGGGPEGRGLGGLEAAVCAGRHDGLLLPLPGTLGSAGRLMRLLLCCTRHGVVVGFVPAASPWPGEW